MSFYEQYVDYRQIILFRILILIVTKNNMLNFLS